MAAKDVLPTTGTSVRVVRDSGNPVSAVGNLEVSPSSRRKPGFNASEYPANWLFFLIKSECAAGHINTIP